MMTIRNTLAAAAFGLAFGLAGTAMANGWADVVLDISPGPGSGTSPSPVENPEYATGPKDGIKALFEIGGFLTLGFSNNTCVLGDGDDLTIYGKGGDHINITVNGITVNNKNINGGGLPIDMGDGPGTFNEVTISDHVPGSPAQLDAVRCNFYFSQVDGEGYLNKVNTGATTVEVGVDYVQNFSFKINMLNDGEVVSEGWFATDTLPAEFNVTEVTLNTQIGDNQTGSTGPVAVDLDATGFFGLKFGTSCEVSIRRPDSFYKLIELGKEPPKLQPEFIVLLAGDGLQDDEFCTLDVSVVTDQNPADKWEPTSCDWFVDADAELLEDTSSEVILDWIKLNEGVRLFNADGDLQFGPKDPIWLDPVDTCVGPKDEEETFGIPDILDPWVP